MLTTVRPPLPKDELIKAEEATLVIHSPLFLSPSLGAEPYLNLPLQARELQWLLSSLQDTLLSLKSGLQESLALLAPTLPGSTLVVSSLKSESVKGFITRVGTRIVKGDINLLLRTLPPPPRLHTYPLRLSTQPTAPELILHQLVAVRNLINQSLDVVDISTWTGDPQDASFISGQLRLLHDFVQEARQMLRGGEEVVVRWCEEGGSLHENMFAPPIPPTLAVTLTVTDASLVLTFRTLEPHAAAQGTDMLSTTLGGISLRQRLGLVAQLPKHDENEEVFVYKGQEVKVKEKVRVESQDPSLMAVMAKLSALEHVVGWARGSLGIVMGVPVEED